MSPVIALCLLAQAQPSAGEPSAAQLVSKMLARYAGAETLSGTIRLTQTAQGASLQIETQVQYRRAQRQLFIRQVRSGASPRTWLVVCDGRMFAYDTPVDFDDKPGKRLYERVDAGPSLNLDFGGVYAATSGSLGDRSAPLDLAVGRLEDLKFRRAQWATLAYGPDAPNGVRVVRGDWREYGNAPPSGQYEMWITPAGDLVRYVQNESVTVPEARQTITISSTWTVSLEAGAKVDPAVFANPR